jgi:hypothetical protein
MDLKELKVIRALRDVQDPLDLKEPRAIRVTREIRV